MRTARPTPTLFPPAPPPALKPNPLKQFYPGLPIGNENDGEDGVEVENEHFIENEDACEDVHEVENEDVHEDNAFFVCFCFIG